MKTNKLLTMLKIGMVSISILGALFVYFNTSTTAFAEDEEYGGPERFIRIYDSGAIGLSSSLYKNVEENVNKDLNKYKNYEIKDIRFVPGIDRGTNAAALVYFEKKHKDTKGNRK